MSGDSPYRRPERPAQLVTDERVGAHIEAIILDEMRRSRAVAARRRRRRLLGYVCLAAAVPLLPAGIALLWVTEHQTLALWTIIVLGAALGAWGLNTLIARIPARSDPPQ